MTGNTIGTVAGGLLGTILGGPGLGTAAGTTAGGFIGGLFDEQSQAPAYQDMTDPRLSALSARLRRQKLGQQQAARQRVLNTRNAKRQTESFENDPNASRSASLRSGVYNSAYTNAEEANVNANVAGAGLDLAAEERAGNVDLQNQNLSLQRNQFARQGWQLNQVPSVLDSAGSTAFGLGIGNLLSQGAPNPSVPSEAEGSAIADQTVSNASSSFMPPHPEIPAANLPPIESAGFPPTQAPDFGTSFPTNNESAFLPTNVMNPPDARFTMDYPDYGKNVYNTGNGRSFAGMGNYAR